MTIFFRRKPVSALKILVKARPLILPVVYLTAICVFFLRAFSANAQALALKVNIFEPFIGMTNHRFSFMLFSSFAVLVYEAVAENGCQQDIPGKMDKKLFRVVMGIVTHHLLIAFSISTLIFLASVLYCIPNISLKPGWSRAVLLLATSGRAVFPIEAIQIRIPLNIIRMYAPYLAFVQAYVLATFMFSMYGGILRLLKALACQAGGIYILFFTHIMHWSSDIVFQSYLGQRVVSWVLVGYHMSFSEHWKRRLDPSFPSIIWSIVLMFLLSALSVLLSAAVQKRKSDRSNTLFGKAGLMEENN